MNFLWVLMWTPHIWPEQQFRFLSFFFHWLMLRQSFHSICSECGKLAGTTRLKYFQPTLLHVPWKCRSHVYHIQEHLFECLFLLKLSFPWSVSNIFCKHDVLLLPSWIKFCNTYIYKRLFASSSSQNIPYEFCFASLHCNGLSFEKKFELSTRYNNQSKARDISGKKKNGRQLWESGNSISQRRKSKELHTQI